MKKGTSEKKYRVSGSTLPDVTILKERLSEKMLKKDVIQLARSLGKDGRILLKLSLLTHPESANRASWTFRAWAQQHKMLIPPLFNNILKVLLKTNNASVKRNLSGVWVDLEYPPEADAKVVDYAFHELGVYGQPVAVYANMLGILRPALKRHPELIPEFLLVIQDQPYATGNWFRLRIKELTTE